VRPGAEFLLKAEKGIKKKRSASAVTVGEEFTKRRQHEISMEKVEERG